MDFFDFVFNLLIQQVSKNVAAACVGAKNLHTARPWLQKTGMNLDSSEMLCCFCCGVFFSVCPQ